MYLMRWEGEGYLLALAASLSLTVTMPNLSARCRAFSASDSPAMGCATAGFSATAASAMGLASAGALPLVGLNSIGALPLLAACGTRKQTSYSLPYLGRAVKQLPLYQKAILRPQWAKE